MRCLHNKKLILLFFILVSINIISAVDLGIDKTSLDFNCEINQRICQTINIYTNYQGNVLAETRWSNIFSKNINDYYSNNKIESNLTIDYEKQMIIFNSKEEEICVTGKKSGKYFGALLYRTENSPAGVGIWINVSVNSGNVEINDVSKINQTITGNVIYNEDFKLNIIYIIPSLFLLLLLIFLFFYQRRVVR